MKSKVCVAVAMAVLAAGCATSVPTARNFPPVEQKKSMSVQHWGMIAADAVERTRDAMAQQGIAKERPLYVAEKTGTEFDRAFRNYMITGLVNAGLPVSARKEDAVEILYETQVIRHASAFDPASAGYKPGTATAGVAGFWVLRDAFRTWPSGSLAGAAIGGAAAFDTYKAFNPGETGVELLVTTSILQSDRYVMRNTDAYYLEKGDAYLFEECDGKFWRRNCK